jgi:hypothetical protein
VTGVTDRDREIDRVIDRDMDYFSVETIIIIKMCQLKKMYTGPVSTACDCFFKKHVVGPTRILRHSKDVLPCFLK